MKFVADVNIAHKVIKLLRQNGHDIKVSRETEIVLKRDLEIISSKTAVTFRTGTSSKAGDIYSYR